MSVGVLVVGRHRDYVALPDVAATQSGKHNVTEVRRVHVLGCLAQHVLSVHHLGQELIAELPHALDPVVHGVHGVL